MHSVGIKHDGLDAARERAMKALAKRLDVRIREVTDRADRVAWTAGPRRRGRDGAVRTHFAVQERIDETRAALLGSVSLAHWPD